MQYTKQLFDTNTTGLKTKIWQDLAGGVASKKCDTFNEFYVLIFLITCSIIVQFTEF